jgi:WD40 repeat protein
MTPFLLILVLAVQPPTPLDFKPKTSLSGELGTFTSVAFAPDGKTIAAANTDRTIRIWEASPARAVAVLQKHASFVNTVAFSPDGKWLASGDMEGLIKLWDAHAWREQRTLRGHTDSVRSAAFSPDSKVLASGSQDGTVRLWEVQTGKEMAVLRSKQKPAKSVIWESDYYPVLTVAFSPLGKLLAAADDAGCSLWDLKTRAELERVSANVSLVRGLSFSSDGDWLALAGNDFRREAPRTRIAIWNVQMRKYYKFAGNQGVVYGLAFNPDHQLLASAESDGTVKLWSPTGRPMGVLRGHEAAVYSVSFSPDGRLLATASADNTVKLWDVPKLAKQP